MKFYATCGSQSLVVIASSAQQAAMRLIDEALGAHIWLYDDDSLTEQQRRDHLVLEALLHLAPRVLVSECGAGRSEAGDFGVPELIEEWHQLMTAVSHLFVAAGIDARRLLPEEVEAWFERQLPR